MSARVDHLIWAAPDLDAGVAEIEERLGAELVVGGVHPQWGTKNYIGSLGPAVYLEVIGPDPEHAGPRPTLLGLDRMTAPRLVTWAAAGVDLAAVAERAASAGVPLGEVERGARETPEGTRLEWALTSPDAAICDRIVPFFIDWGETPHPGDTSPAVGELVGLRLEHPDPEQVRRTFAALGLGAFAIHGGDRPRIIARVATEAGTLEIG